MKNLTNILNILVLVCCCLFVGTNSYGQTLEDVIVEEYAVDAAGPGLVTYRVFLDMGPGDRLLAVYGFDDADPTTGNPISFNTTTTFYQDNFGGDFGEGVNSLLFSTFATAAYDTWVSVGAAATGQAGIPLSEDTDGSSLNGNTPDGYTTAAVVSTNSAGFTFPGVTAVSSIGTPDGAYFVAGGAEGVGPNNTICIGQFTTDGDFSFEINVQLQNSGEEQIFLHTNAGQPDGTTGVVDSRLKFPSVGVAGCTDPLACNFDAAATTDDGSCTDQPVVGCTECNGNVLEIIDGDGDGVCDADEVAGCTNALACNFDAAATDNDGSCTDAPVANCSECSGMMLVIIDADSDGTCDADDTCVNDPNKVDPGACGCGVADTDTDSDGTADCNDGCPSDPNKVASGECGCGNSDVDNSGNGIADCNDVLGCTNPNADNFDPSANEDDGSCTFAEAIACDGQPGGLEGIVVEEYYENLPTSGQVTYRVFADLAVGYKLLAVYGFDDADPSTGNVLEFATTTGFYNDAFGSEFGEGVNSLLFGSFQNAALDTWVSFGAAATGQRGILKVDDVDGSNLVPFLSTPPADGIAPASQDGYTAGSTPGTNSAGLTTTGATVDGANFIGSGDGAYFIAGGVEPVGASNAVLIGQFTTDGDFSFKLNVQVQDAFGDEELYLNTNSGQPDGTFGRVCSDLIFPGLPGCTDALACNFDAAATVDDGTCIVPVADCSECNATNDGLDPIDDDNDGVCNADEALGCTDVLACNFDITVDAGNDDGSCIVPEDNCTECNANNDGLELIDDDGDGTCNALDGCPNDPNKLAPGDCGCGVSDVDSDTDGTPDCNDGCPDDFNKVDPGVCGCGVPDLDSDSDGTLDCNDNCPNDPLKTEPGTCGCGTPDTDSDNDNDGPDCIDPCPLLPDLANGDPCTAAGGESGFVQDCECVPGAKPQCISPVACNYFDPTGLVEGPQGDYINDPSLCDEPVGCKTCDASVDADDVDANGNPTPDGDGIGASVVPSEFDSNANGICDDEEEQGCTSLTACNYDPAAVVDDGSCFEPVPMCAICGPNGSIIFIDSDGDGICNAEEVPGCTDESACNFDVDATDNNGSCLVPELGCSECDGMDLVASDNNNNGIDDCEEVLGCTDVNACNYDESANVDNGSCLIPVDNCSRCLEVGGTVILLPIDDDYDGTCNADEVLGCTSPTACNFDPEATDDNGTCFEPVDDCLVCAENGEGLEFVDSDFDGICDGEEIAGCTDEAACNFNEFATDDDGSCEIAEMGCTVCVNGDLVLQDNDGDGICNLVDMDDDNDGCKDGVDPAPLTASADDDGDGVGNDCDICEGDDASGDTDGDGICDDSEIDGCTSGTACNFDPAATDDDGSCLEPVDNCTACQDGELVLIDADGDKVCDANEVPGCTDVAACNFDADATDEDGSCVFAEEGCSVCEEGDVVIIDTDGDGICDGDEVLGCTDASACNFDPAATDDDNTCLVPVADCLECNLDGSGLVIVDSDNDGVCDAEEVPGCTDSKACNFNPEATDDDGSCLVPTEDCEECAIVNGEVVLVIVDSDDDGVCDAEEVPGCTDEAACNFNPLATDEDNDVCIVPTENCTECAYDIELPNGDILEVGLSLIDSDGDKVCDAEEVPGCTNPAAINFDMDATDDDGSCLFECVEGDNCESFESGLASWTNRTSDDIDWTLNSDGTPSNGTGPDAAFEGSNYVYVEASGTNMGGKVAELESPCYQVDGPSFVKFAYHMKGSGGSVGTLTLEIKTAAGNAFVPLWSMSGAQGPNWNIAEVALPAQTLGENVQFRLVGTTANSFLGDIAVDDFCVQEVLAGCTDPMADNWDPAATMDDGSCTFLDCANVRNLPYCRSFNAADNFGGFANVGGDDFDWLQRNGSTVSMGTGPSSGNSGSGYIYMEASAPNNPFKSAIIESPCLDLSGTASPAVSFAYHMWGAYVGQVVLEVSTDGEFWTPIWIKSGNQGNEWFEEAPISLAAYQDEVVRLRFRGFTAHGWQGDIAIDDFCVEESPNAVAPLVVVEKPEELIVRFLESKEAVEFQAPEYADVTAELDVKLFPNPLNASSPLSIEFFNIAEDVEKVQVQVFDITGRQVYAEQFGVSASYMIEQISLNTELAGGTYLVSIVAGSEVKSKRLVLTR